MLTDKQVPLDHSDDAQAGSFWPPLVVLLALTLLAFLLLLSVIPVKLGQIWRWVLHAVLMCAWTFSFIASYRRIFVGTNSLRQALMLSCIAAMAAEVLQLWIPRHEPDLAGLLANLCGVMVAFIISCLKVFKKTLKARKFELNF